MREKGNDTSIIKSVRERYRAQLIDNLVKEQNRIVLFNISSDDNYPLKDRVTAGLAAVKLAHPKYKSIDDPKFRDAKDALLLKVAKGFDARYNNFHKVEYPKEVVIAASIQYVRAATVKELHLFSNDTHWPEDVRNAAKERLHTN